MGECVTMVNHKGGVGKTSTTDALGAGLTLKGYSVLYVELDYQKNLSFSMGVMKEPEKTAFELLTGEATAGEAILHTSRGDLIPGGDSLILAESRLIGEWKEYRLREALEPIKGNYDYILIDAPPSLGIITVNALTASDSTIIPTQADIYSLQGIQLLGKTIKATQKHANRDLTIKGLLITQYNGRSILRREMAELLEETAGNMGTKLFKTRIRQNVAISEAPTNQKDIYSYAPKSNGAKDYMSFTEEFLSRKG